MAVRLPRRRTRAPVWTIAPIVGLVTMGWSGCTLVEHGGEGGGCQISADCSSRFVCVDGVCQLPCNFNEECGAGRQCVNGGCSDCDGGQCATSGPDSGPDSGPCCTEDEDAGGGDDLRPPANDGGARPDLQPQPPSVSISSPLGTTPLRLGQPVPIQWSCSCEGGLAEAPISAIHYTVDSGESVVRIAENLPNNISDTDGVFSWTLPEALRRTPFRIRVECRSAAGLITTATSDLINSWRIFLGGPGSALEGVEASEANVGGATYASGGSISEDAAGAIYYVKGHAIMRIDPETHRVARFAGQPQEGGCAVGPDGDPHSTLLQQPLLLGVTADRSALLVLCWLCEKIYRIGADPPQVVEWSSFSGIGWPYQHFLTAGRQALLSTLNAEGSVKLYRIDLTRAGSPAEWIHGDGPCGPVAAVGTDARSAPFQVGPYYNQCASGHLLLANRDATKIWLNTFTGVNGYRIDLDEEAGHYRIAEVDTGWHRDDNGRCVSTDFDQRIYCPRRDMGSDVEVFDLEAEAWTDPGAFPIYGDDESGFLALGGGDGDLLGLHSLNRIGRLDPAATPEWSFTHVAGLDLATLGNGRQPDLVGLDHPREIEYVAANRTLWIRNRVGHVRRVGLGSNPWVTTTLFSRDLRYENATFFEVSPDGDRLLTGMGCARDYIYNFAIDGESLTLLPPFLHGPCDTTSGAYPPPAWSSATDGAARFVGFAAFASMNPVYHSNHRAYFAYERDGSDVFVYASDGVEISPVAGVEGGGGYDPADEGQPALGAKLASVFQLQEDAQGDLLLWDRLRLRRVTLTTEHPTPRIYTVVNYGQILSYGSFGVWKDALYDEVSGTTYYVNDLNQVRKVHPDLGDHEISFVGNTFLEPPRLALAPEGLLVLQPEAARILEVTP